MKDPIKGRRYCYTVVDADHQDPKKHGGFMPSMIIEGETGHHPMQGGDHQWAVPWIWGKTVKAEVVASMCAIWSLLYASTMWVWSGGRGWILCLSSTR